MINFGCCCLCRVMKCEGEGKTRCAAEQRNIQSTLDNMLRVGGKGRGHEASVKEHKFVWIHGLGSFC